MENFEGFCRAISSSINLSFLKSGFLLEVFLLWVTRWWHVLRAQGEIFLKTWIKNMQEDSNRFTSWHDELHANQNLNYSTVLHHHTSLKYKDWVLAICTDQSRILVTQCSRICKNVQFEQVATIFYIHFYY